MDIQMIINNIKEPKKFTQNEKQLYFDEYRKALIPITPEETIRQKITSYLENYLNVPHDCINTEVHLHHYDGVTENGRIDITIDAINPNDERITMSIVECKAAHIPITTQAIEQAFGYADAIGCDYVIITNGIEMYQYLYSDIQNKYVLLAEIVDYIGMIHHCGIPVVEDNDFTRSTSNQILGDVNKLREYGYKYNFIGEDTSDLLIPYIANISDALVDTSHILTTMHNDTFKLVEDLKCSYLKYDDASGGGFGTGEYRSFLIEDYQKGHRIVNIGILATTKTINDPKYGNTDEKSVLITSLRDNDKDEMVVQINLNKFLSIDDGYISLMHNGAVTRKGAKASELKQIIYNTDKKMIFDNKIFLGKVYGKELLYVDTTDFSNMIKNIITYTIIRDRYKSTFSSKQNARTRNPASTGMPGRSGDVVTDQPPQIHQM